MTKFGNWANALGICVERALLKKLIFSGEINRTSWRIRSIFSPKCAMASASSCTWNLFHTGSWCETRLRNSRTVLTKSLVELRTVDVLLLGQCPRSTVPRCFGHIKCGPINSWSSKNSHVENFVFAMISWCRGLWWRRLYLSFYPWVPVFWPTQNRFESPILKKEHKLLLTCNLVDLFPPKVAWFRKATVDWVSQRYFRSRQKWI